MIALKLHTFFRSSAAYRVRIGLAVKQLEYQAIPVHLRRDGGEHRLPDFLALNPQGFIPALEVEGTVIGQSLAILEYLDERWPNPPLLPSEPLARAIVRSMAQSIACDIHPINNLRVLKYLREHFTADDEAVNGWVRHWIAAGFEGLERLARSHGGTGRYTYGNELSLVDLCLVPQIFNAERFGCDLTPYPTLNAVASHLASLPAFAAAHPSAQPDSE